MKQTSRLKQALLDRADALAPAASDTAQNVGRPTSDETQNVGRPTPATEEPPRTREAGDAGDRLALLPVAHVAPDPGQPRKDLGDLGELMASIRHNGVLQPILVTITGEDAFQIVAGERRWEAVRRLEMPTIPAIVRTVAAHQRLEMQIVENLHRKELLPIEEAVAYKRLMDEFSLTQDQIAQRTGRSRVAVNEILRLLNLPAHVQEESRETPQISKSLLLEIARQPDPERQIALFERAARGNLTVKAVRQERSRVRALRDLPPFVPPAPEPLEIALESPDAVPDVGRPTGGGEIPATEEREEGVRRFDLPGGLVTVTFAATGREPDDVVVLALLRDALAQVEAAESDAPGTENRSAEAV